MLKLVYDLETTGLNYSMSNLLSFGYLLFNPKTFEVLDFDVLYFYRKDYIFTEKAMQINHLTEEFMKQFESEYAENFSKMFKLLYRANVIGYNNNKFDNNFIRVKLLEEEYLEPTFNSSVDVMIATKRKFGNASLEVSAKKEGLENMEEVMEYYSKFRKSKRPLLEPTGFHSAREDVIATFLLHNKLKSQGFIV